MVPSAEQRRLGAKRRVWFGLCRVYRSGWPQFHPQRNRMHLQIAHFPVNRSGDVRLAGQRARRLGALAGLSVRRRNAFGNAVELAMGEVLCGSSAGTLQFGLSCRAGRQHLEAICVQAGDHLMPSAHATPPPAQSLPLRQARGLVDELNVERKVEGLTIGLWMALPDDAGPIGPDAASAWGVLLALPSTQAALSASQRRLDQVGADLRAAQQRESVLRRELENIKHLNETLELLALVASKTENAVVILDGQSRLEWVNDGFVHMTGYEMSEVRGRPIREVFYGPDEGSEAAAEMESATVCRAGHQPGHPPSPQRWPHVLGIDQRHARVERNGSGASVDRHRQ